MLRPALNNPQWARSEQLWTSLLCALCLHVLLLGINGLWPEVKPASKMPPLSAYTDIASAVNELADEAGIVARASSGNALPGESLAKGLERSDGADGNTHIAGLDESDFLSVAEEAASAQLLLRQSPLKVFYSASQQRQPGQQALTRVPSAANREQGDAGDAELSALSQPERVLSLGAASREDVALQYVEGWRRWMRANGNLFYPAEARRLGLRGEVLTEVRLNSDGSLANVRILRSSGQRLLDEAVLQTTKEARWYLPFPPELAARYQQLEFSWRWRYGGAASQRAE